MTSVLCLTLRLQWPIKVRFGVRESHKRRRGARDCARLALSLALHFVSRACIALEMPLTT